MVSIIPFYKDSEEYEIACMLFENCNLKCKFCFEPHTNKKIDKDYILTIPNIIRENFSQEYKKYPTIKKVWLMLWGGEIFYDALTDDIFDTYYKFVDNLNEIFKNDFPNVEIIYSWLSNGVFTKRERVEKLIKYSKGIINFSYDPINRFSTKKQKQTMIDTALYFANKGGDKISITLTKDNIKEFIENDNELINFYNMGYTIDVNYYIPNINWKNLLPSDDDIFSFLKWAVDNRLFNMKIIERIFHNYTSYHLGRYCNCKYCSQITYGSWSKDCVVCSTVLPAKMFYQENTDEINEENSNEIKATMGLKKRGCLTCEYYEKCQMPCWISFIFENAKAENCPYKQIYNYIETHTEMIDEFRKWFDDKAK